MSAPIDDQGFSDALRYAPPWARRIAPETADADLRTATPEPAVDATGAGFDLADDLAADDTAPDDPARDDPGQAGVPHDDDPGADLARPDFAQADFAHDDFGRPEVPPSPVAPGGAGPEVILGVRFGDTPTLPQDLDELAAARRRARRAAAGNRGV
ncbi:hypothetical protein PQJ75_30885, partial [Rhodoplanes sp. TEM]|nr:hypothetical protein [Rhodoplanes sp. TEM]